LASGELTFLIASSRPDRMKAVAARALEGTLNGLAAGI
jgi:hypothetical protein